MDYILTIMAIVGPIASAFGAGGLICHRLNRLEQKVDAHNQFDARIARLEAKLEEVQRK